LRLSAAELRSALILDERELLVPRHILVAPFQASTQLQHGVDISAAARGRCCDVLDVRMGRKLRTWSTGGWDRRTEVG
jgi:hypothetical protein